MSAERDILAAARERIVVYDGGMGATLERFELSEEDYGGLKGKCHEALVLHRPDVIQGVHESMLEAGAQVLETDSFQGSRLKLDEWGLAEHTIEINRGAAEIARKAAGPDRFVAGSIGPTGFLPASDDPTLGDITFAQLAVISVLTTGYGVGAADALAYGVILQAVEIATAVGLGLPALVREGMSWSDVRLRAMSAAPVRLQPTSKLRAAARKERVGEGAAG